MRRWFIAVACVACTGCGAEPLLASFTSRVVQHESCKVVGDRPEVCLQEETLLDLRVRLVERDDDNVWLYGIPRGGVSERAILGTRDNDGGFLFIDETSEENDAAGCILGERLELSLRIDPKAKVEDIGTDPCVALLGRETETTTSSAGCDVVNDPPLSSTLQARRRWEAPPECAP